MFFGVSTFKRCWRSQGKRGNQIQINHLASSLGDFTPIDLQRLSGAAPNPPDPRNATAALGVGAQNGRNRETRDQATFEARGYHDQAGASTIVLFRPRRDAILIEYAVTHWTVTRVHAGTGARTPLGSAGAIVTAAAYARFMARRYGVAIILGSGAAGWRYLMQEVA